MTSAGLVKASLTPALTKPEEEKTLEALTKKHSGCCKSQCDQHNLTIIAAGYKLQDPFRCVFLCLQSNYTDEPPVEDPNSSMTDFHIDYIICSCIHCANCGNSKLCQ
jgi:hypothetical protein